MIKKALRKLTNSVGYNIVKLPTNNLNDVVINVGNYPLTINGVNGLIYCYTQVPDYGKQLSRLVKYVSTKNSEFNVIDVGANLGDTVALIKTGSDVPVICIEGDKQIVPLFEKNTQQFQDVQLIETFLSDKMESINIILDKPGHNGTIKQVSENEDSFTIQLITLDSLYEKNVIGEHSKILKIDTEGYDLKVLRGSQKFIEEVKPVLFFEFNREALAPIEKNALDIFGLLESWGYSAILYYESDGRFMFSTELSNRDIMRQMYEYVDGEHAKIYYMDLMIFHSSDEEWAKEFIRFEEQNRSKLDKAHQ